MVGLTTLSAASATPGGCHCLTDQAEQVLLVGCGHGISHWGLGNLLLNTACLLLLSQPVVHASSGLAGK